MYYRTYTVMNGMPMGLADPATLSAFRLDKYEVTVGRSGASSAPGTMDPATRRRSALESTAI